MKRSENGQETIVLGSGLGGLIAGTLLAKNDHSVLLLKEKGYQPSYTIKGYRFTPFSSVSEKRFKSGLLKKISQALNLPSLLDSKEEDKQAKIISGQSRRKATFQVILPKARIDISSRRGLFQKEWKREFPKEVVQIEEFYNELDQLQHFLRKPKSKMNTSSFFPIRQRSFMKNIFSFAPFPREKMDQRLSPFSREFKEFVKLQLVSWGNLYSDQFPTSLAAHILLEEMNELTPNFHLEKLEEGILKQFLRYGGKVEEIDRVKQVEIRWREGQTLSLDRDRMVFRSNLLIFNSSFHHISSLLGKKGKALLKWQERIKPLYVMIPIFLGIHEKVIPVGMKDLLISILDVEKPYQDGNVLFLSLSPKGDETQAPDGNRALTVESLMRFEKWEQTLLVDYQYGVLKHLCHLFPFLESHIDFVDFKWASEQVPRWSYSHFLYGATSDFDWGEGIVPIKLLKNVYFVGKENFPYLGAEGEILAGFMVAQQILKKYS
jgi:phytoene dehydrogenase-like protein